MTIYQYYFDENNLTIRPCTMDEIRHIKKFLGKESEHKLKNAFYVKNIVTEACFMITVPRIKFLIRTSIIFIMDPVMKTGGIF